MEKARDNPAWQLEKVIEAQRDKKESALCYVDGRMSPQKRGVRTKITEVLRQSRAPW